MTTAIVPTTLEQKLFGEEIAYVDNYINVDGKDVAEFFGPQASAYSYKPQLRKRLTEIVEAAKRCMNRWYVLEGETVRAAQSSLNGAMQHMNASRVLVRVDV